MGGWKDRRRDAYIKLKELSPSRTSYWRRSSFAHLHVAYVPAIRYANVVGKDTIPPASLKARSPRTVSRVVHIAGTCIK